MRMSMRGTALALLAVALPASAYVRETTTPGNPATGVCQWWGARQVTYVVNVTGIPTSPNGHIPCGSATAAEDAVRLGFQGWFQSCTDFRFVDGGITGQIATGYDHVNLVVFRSRRCQDVVPVGDPCLSTKGACANKYNCWEHDVSGSSIDTVALTTNTWDLDTGEILDSDIEFHEWNGLSAPAYGAFFTCTDVTAPSCGGPPYAVPGCTSVDVATVTLHEAGHMLGLDHDCQYAAPYDSCVPGSIMAPTTSGIQRLVGDDDAAGLCAIYPSRGPTAKCVSESPKKGGCNTGGGEAGALALLAALASWRRSGLRRSRR